MRLLLDIQDNKAAFLLEILNSLPFVKTQEIVEDDEVFTQELQSSLNQVREMRDGKLAKQSIAEFLDEL